MGVRKKHENRLALSSEAGGARGHNDETRTAQTKRLILEYEKIASPEVREEFIALLQVVSKKPELLIHPKGRRNGPHPKFLH